MSSECLLHFFSYGTFQLYHKSNSSSIYLLAGFSLDTPNPKPRISHDDMGDCQNYGLFLGPCYNTGPNLGDPKKDHNFDTLPYASA